MCIGVFAMVSGPLGTKSYRQLWAALRILEIEHRSSVRAVCALTAEPSLPSFFSFLFLIAAHSEMECLLELRTGDLNTRPLQEWAQRLTAQPRGLRQNTRNKSPVIYFLIFLLTLQFPQRNAKLFSSTNSRQLCGNYHYGFVVVVFCLVFSFFFVFVSYTAWVLRLKLRLSDLVASAFTLRSTPVDPICILKCFIIVCSNIGVYKFLFFISFCYYALSLPFCFFILFTF